MPHSCAHCREERTSDGLVDALIGVVAEAVALMDQRFFLSRIDDVAQTLGRYFEVSLDEASEMTTARCARSRRCHSSAASSATAGRST